MSKAVEFLYLSQEDVIAAGGLDMKTCLDAVERAFKLLAVGEVKVPNKIVMELPPSEQERGRINGLAAYIGGDWEVAGIKWIPSFPKNPREHGLPRASALLILNNTNTGTPLAVMDGTIINAMRTGAMGGLGAKYLARKDSEVAAFIGLGVQARTQAMALKEVLHDLKEFRGYDNRKQAAENATKIQELTGIKTIAVSNPKKAVEGADVITTITTADEPIVKNAWMKKGTLFTHIGSYQEEEYEVVLHSDKLIVDDWEVVKHRGTPVLAKMYKQGLIKDEDIYASFSEVVSGTKKGRESDHERIFFSPIGMAHEDIAFASMVYQKAKDKKIGQKLRLWTKPFWV